MNPRSFQRLATAVASTKRSDLTTGFATELTGLKCLPLMPVDPETRKRLELNTPHVIYETYLHGDLDIRKGDRLVVDSVEYPIHSVAPWPWQSDIFLHLILEDLRN